MTVPAMGVSEGVPINAIVKTSMAASVLALFTKSPAEPTLDGSDEMSAIKTPVSSKVDQPEWIDGADINTVCAVKPIRIATMGHTIDSTH